MDNTPEFEQCSCDEALFYKTKAIKLAKAVIRHATHENQGKYGTIFHLAEIIVPAAEEIINAKPKEPGVKA